MYVSIIVSGICKKSTLLILLFSQITAKYYFEVLVKFSTQRRAKLNAQKREV